MSYHAAIVVRDASSRQVRIRVAGVAVVVGRRRFLALVDDICRLKGTTLLAAEGLSRQVAIEAAADLIIYQRTGRWAAEHQGGPHGPKDQTETDRVRRAAG